MGRRFGRSPIVESATFRCFDSQLKRCTNNHEHHRTPKWCWAKEQTDHFHISVPHIDNREVPPDVIFGLYELTLRLWKNGANSAVKYIRGLRLWACTHVEYDWVAPGPWVPRQGLLGALEKKTWAWGMSPNLKFHTPANPQTCTEQTHESNRMFLDEPWRLGHCFQSSCLLPLSFVIHGKVSLWLAVDRFRWHLSIPQRRSWKCIQRPSAFPVSQGTGGL